MIDKESVITTENSFVVVDKITRQQNIKGYKQVTRILKIRDGKSMGIMVDIPHAFIIVSPNQKFIVGAEDYKEAHELTTEDMVLTALGFFPVTYVQLLPDVYDMSDIQTEQKAFYANSFLLLAD